MENMKIKTKFKSISIILIYTTQYLLINNTNHILYINICCKKPVMWQISKPWNGYYKKWFIC